MGQDGPRCATSPPSAKTPRLEDRYSPCPGRPPFPPPAHQTPLGAPPTVDIPPRVFWTLQTSATNVVTNSVSRAPTIDTS
eukprot:458958-Prorocentrum_minimum.AAC.1